MEVNLQDIRKIKIPSQIFAFFQNILDNVPLGYRKLEIISSWPTLKMK